MSEIYFVHNDKALLNLNCFGFLPVVGILRPKIVDFSFHGFLNLIKIPLFLCICYLLNCRWTASSMIAMRFT